MEWKIKYLIWKYNMIQSFKIKSERWYYNKIKKIADKITELRKNEIKTIFSGNVIKNAIDRGYLDIEHGCAIETDYIPNLDIQNEDFKKEFNSLFPNFELDGFLFYHPNLKSNRMYILYNK